MSEREDCLGAEKGIVDLLQERCPAIKVRALLVARPVGPGAHSPAVMWLKTEAGKLKRELEAIQKILRKME